MSDIKNEILSIISSTPHLPAILENILVHNSILADDESVIEYIYLDRHGYALTDSFIEKRENWQPATLILATSFGLIILEEGGTLISEGVYGYRVRHLMYEKISGIELDICLLSGCLRIYSSGSSEAFEIGFNTSLYHDRFETFVNLIRHKIIGFTRFP